MIALTAGVSLSSGIEISHKIRWLSDIYTYTHTYTHTYIYIYIYIYIHILQYTGIRTVYTYTRQEIIYKSKDFCEFVKNTLKY